MESDSDNRTIPFDDLTEQLCQKLNCSALADDIERVNHARELLATLQQKEAFHQLMGDPEPQETPFEISQILLKTKLRLAVPSTSATDISAIEDAVEEGAEEFETAEVFDCNDLSDDAWLGFFKGFEILNEDQEYSISENKQCIEISHNDCDSMLAAYLRAGVRCFVVDLFKGTELDNQRLIFQLRENELKISREYGFPITATLFAMLSPRCQYTGVLEPHDARHELKKDDVITLTTDRQYSIKGTCDKVYVNARFLIDDCKLGDYMLIGPSLQVQIIHIGDNGELRCLVMEPGPLRSRLPVRFPGRCSRYSISVEEIEDITFAREVGINVLVSHIPGTMAYLEDLQKVFRLLNCENLRLCTRVVLNEITDDGPDLQWIADRYDGFILDFSLLQQKHQCPASEAICTGPEVLDLSSAAVEFTKKIFELKKPIIMDPMLIGDRKLLVQPCHEPEVFYYPDKYLFKCDRTRDSFYFYLLQNAIFAKMPEYFLSMLPYCDRSHSGSDSLARSCVAASFESQAVAILVCCSAMPDVAIKLSHFRPKAPIIYISPTKSTADYISMYHNIVHLYFPARGDYNHGELVTNGLIFGLLFLKCRKIIKKGQNVVLVYDHGPGTKLPDKYVVYRFDETKFANHLFDILFA